MTTIPYSDLLAGIEALCGATLATVERTRIKAFVNRRARKAYAECRYWPRFLKVEERVVSEDGLLPYEETGLSTIGQVFRIHADQPYQRDTSLEYVDFSARADGIQITNYQPNNDPDNMVLTGTATPDVTGTYYPVSATLYTIDGASSAPASGTWSVISYNSFLQLWESFRYIDGVSQALIEGYFFEFSSAATPSGLTLSPQNGAIGSVLVTPDNHTAFVTYKAKLTSTYGDGDGEDEDVPEEWFDYLMNGAYADWLRNEGQNEKAIVEDQLATEFLTQQLEKLDAQSGSYVFGNILTTANTQTR